MFEPLPRTFYEPSAQTVAPLLLGHFLVRNTAAGSCGGIIVETEAYLANDPACHAYLRETPRNRSMYGPPGHAYVYFIYGNHYCFNTVCCQAGVAEAVLVRAIEPALGADLLRVNRRAVNAHDLTNGPAKCCEAMGIDRRFDGVDLCDAAAPLLVARHPEAEAYRKRYGPLAVSARIGIRQAAELPLRFYLAGNPWVSSRRTRPVPLGDG